ncbi:hypothetical protein K227x_55290 [Rubripirellula lacrimiformis]|uniref:HlyD family secretion protein n=1 Tax=Rubripirellula lacrimiformis TaxID=1930273 RepID=A0A517NIZ8_9BACT|nr:MchE protein [Rubripirellula lacrimiformis]QDT07104.1 hypothetical protein K227x_55290 [Rubripirellula lacrimiformis]
MKPNRFRFNTFIGPTILIVAAAALWSFRAELFPVRPAAEAQSNRPPAQPDEDQTVLEISVQARKNLGLVSAPARPQTYWRSVTIPGVIADRPGQSDRGVTSPAVGIVTAVHAFPGDTIRPGDGLFTLRLFSEYLQHTQTQLFKANQETRIIQEQIDRLSAAATTGAVSKAKMIELAANMTRQRAVIQSSRQDLLTRGLQPQQIDRVEQQGQFVSTIDVTAPPPLATDSSADTPASDTTTSDTTTGAPTAASDKTEDRSAANQVAYEVQELSVEMGQQVQAGQLLAKLSNHQLLYVVGHAFKREATFLEQATQEGRPVTIDFTDDRGDEWETIQPSFQIRHLSNSIDTNSRTFDFFVPLMNQSRSYQKSGNEFLVWRFRPGQRVRIQIPVESFLDVIVLPAAAVVRDGPEAYVFRQNGDLFKRLSVHVQREDRLWTVVANDGSIPPGSYLAQSSAASLNRVLRAQTASGAQPGLHVHPDGTTHAAH